MQELVEIILQSLQMLGVGPTELCKQFETHYDNMVTYVQQTAGLTASLFRSSSPGLNSNKHIRPRYLHLPEFLVERVRTYMLPFKCSNPSPQRLKKGMRTFILMHSTTLWRTPVNTNRVAGTLFSGSNVYS